MKVCELSKTVPVSDLKPGDTFEYGGKAYIMTEIMFESGKGLLDEEDEKTDRTMAVAVNLNSGTSVYMFYDEEVTKLDLMAVRGGC